MKSNRSDFVFDCFEIVKIEHQSVLARKEMCHKEMLEIPNGIRMGL